METETDRTDRGRSRQMTKAETEIRQRRTEAGMDGDRNRQRRTEAEKDGDRNRQRRTEAE